MFLTKTGFQYIIFKMGEGFMYEGCNGKIINF